MLQTLSKWKVEENFLNLIKNIYKNPTADITTFNDEKLAFQMRWGIRQGYSLSPFLSNIIFIKLSLFTDDIVVYRKPKSKNLTKASGTNKQL